MDDQQFKQALEEIATDRKRGASELARRCLGILAESARAAPAGDGHALKERLVDRTTRLAEARPSMAPIQNLLRCWRETLASIPRHDLDAARHQAADSAETLADASRKAVTRIAEHMAGYLGSRKTLMCHSLSSTLVEVCRVLRDRELRMIITESRPLYEGRRLAQTLSEWNVPTTFITEAQMGLFVGKADAALVGADRLLADGAVINKAGTYLLALAARDRGIPFYACCESFKCSDATPQTVTLEEMDAAELQMPDWPHVKVRNIYFDITPARLVSAWITEEGVMRVWKRS